MDGVRTKIVATLGPASREEDSLRALIQAGVNVFRINFSHGTADEHRDVIRRVRSLSDQSRVAVGVLADLQGPKMRIGKLPAPRTLKTGEVVSLCSGGTSAADAIPCTFERLHEDVRPGEPILLDDGNLELTTVEVADGVVRARVVHGGVLRSGKGLNLPGTEIHAPSLTTKDEADLQLALEEGVDFVALSFVRTAADVRDLRSRLPHRDQAPEVIAKIERPEAVRNIREILEVADGVMIARGDMGVELGPEEVPPIQKQIIRLCVDAAKPVITATQMLESMIESPRPTRAEASDVANAIYDGTSALMLSAETATGAHPVQVVRTMVRIAQRTEAELYGSTFLWERRRGRGDGERSSISVATVRAAAQAALSVHADALVVFTESGRTAKLVARERLPMRLLACTPHARSWRRLTLQWGIRPILTRRVADVEEMRERGQRRLVELGMLKGGERAVFIAGRVQITGATNSLLILDIPDGSDEVAPA